jgi:chemotaxis protein methyltransferase CheR
MNANELSDKDFALFRDLVYNKCGINLHEGKKELVRARLGKRLRQTQFKSFREYYEAIVGDASSDELVHMLDAISTNLTSFFREIKHFDFLEKHVLSPGAKGWPQSAGATIHVWSAGCSSGEEPYSLFMCFNEVLEKRAISVQIMATDISTRMLATAQSGVYHESRVRTVPAATLRKYFQKGQGKWAGHYRAKDFMRNAIEFKRFNLMAPFPFAGKFQVIFCRNVMIYFDKFVQEQLVNKFYDCLSDGGYLFIGHSESLMSINHRFKYVRPTIYLRP